VRAIELFASKVAESIIEGKKSRIAIELEEEKKAEGVAVEGQASEASDEIKKDVDKVE